MNKDLELYYSLELMEAINNQVELYVFNETRLTRNTLYSDADAEFYNEVVQEIIPEPLNNLLLNLKANYSALVE